MQFFGRFYRMAVRNYSQSGTANFYLGAIGEDSCCVFSTREGIFCDLDTIEAIQISELPTTFNLIQPQMVSADMAVTENHIIPVAAADSDRRPLGPVMLMAFTTPAKDFNNYGHFATPIILRANALAFFRLTPARVKWLRKAALELSTVPCKNSTS